MLVCNYKDVPVVKTKYSDKRVVIGPKQGAPNFVMRVIDMPPGASYYHSHDWEHEVFVHAGHGVVLINGDTVELGPGSVVFIASGQKHQLKNSGKEPLVFVCVIPSSAPEL